MTALDSCEPQVISAFQKAGWKIFQKPHLIPYERSNLWADASFQRVVGDHVETIIIVEIKCFTNQENDLQEFYTPPHCKSGCSGSCHRGNHCMENLADIVKKTVFWYAGGGFNLQTFPLSNDEKQVYSVIVVDTPVHTRPASIAVSARIVGDTVIIDEDTTDKPLAEALVRNGVPPEKIIKAYAGEPIPEAL